MNNSLVFVTSILIVIIIFLSISLIMNSKMAYGQFFGYTLQENISVPSNGNAVSSTTNLDNGVNYKIVASGEATPGISDTEFGYPKSVPENNCGNSESGTDIGVGINDPDNDSSKYPSWGNYKDNHKYINYFIGRGKPITLNYHDCFFDDNSGSMTVEIFKIIDLPQPDETVLQGQLMNDCFSYQTQSECDQLFNPTMKPPQTCEPSTDDDSLCSESTGGKSSMLNNFFGILPNSAVNNITIEFIDIYNKNILGFPIDQYTSYLDKIFPVLDAHNPAIVDWIIRNYHYPNTDLEVYR